MKFKVAHRILLRFFEKTRFRKVSGFYSWIGPRCREVEIELDILRDRGALVQDERAGLWGDIRGIRPYRQGDSLGLIHWLSTARHQSWMSKELEEARGLSVSLRWAPLQHEELEAQLSDLHSVISRLLEHRVDVHLELDVIGALELHGDRGLQQLNLALAQFGFVDVDNRALTTRNALCLGSAKPRSQAERLYHLSEVFREAPI